MKTHFPYLPREGKIRYVKASDSFMRAAQEVANRFSLDTAMPNGSVIVKDGLIIGSGANGSPYHGIHGCERAALGVPTGQGYELCEGCHPKNHSEQQAIRAALSHANSLTGARLYLWGHWWCCKACWDMMLRHGITTVYLVEGSKQRFNKRRARK